MIVVLFALNLQAGPLGLVEPGQHPNYDAQIPGQMFSNLAPSVPLEVLLKENPQYYFGFRKNESGAELFAYFDPVLPSTQVIVTTKALGLVLKEEPNFERFVPLIVVPPVDPPPTCVYDCGGPPVVPPVSEVPEGDTFYLGSLGLLLMLFGSSRSVVK